MERDFDEIHVQFAKKDIYCKDCKYRDKTMVKIGNKKIYSGVTRSNCEKYTDHKGKPYDILFEGAKCAFYQKG